MNCIISATWLMSQKISARGVYHRVVAREPEGSVMASASTPHWVIAGVLLALTCFAPEQWLARADDVRRDRQQGCVGTYLAALCSEPSENSITISEWLLQSQRVRLPAIMFTRLGHTDGGNQSRS